jgi:hypothetical protein
VGVRGSVYGQSGWPGVSRPGGSAPTDRFGKPRVYPTEPRLKYVGARQITDLVARGVAAGWWRFGTVRGREGLGLVVEGFELVVAVRFRQLERVNNRGLLGGQVGALGDGAGAGVVGVSCCGVIKGLPASGSRL